LRAFGHQRLCNGQADACAATGDQRVLSVQCHVFVLPFVWDGTGLRPCDKTRRPVTKMIYLLTYSHL
jgi:hypothetical protein